MRNTKYRISANHRRTNLLAGLLFASSLAALLLAFALAGPAMADEEPDTGCCVCACSELATTSGRPDGAGICFDGPSSACGTLCGSCGVDSFSEASCDNVSGCAQAVRQQTMAPTASPLMLVAIAIALALLGLYTVTDPAQDQKS